MAAHELNCPSCGAPIVIESRRSRAVICQYCGQTSHVRDENLDPSGKSPPLVDTESIFSIGATGTVMNRKFRVLGRLRYGFDGGFWDEWLLLRDDDSLLWMQEDEGTLVAFEKADLTEEVSPFESMDVGATYSLEAMNVFITEKNDAVIAGGEGELGFALVPGESARCVDGIYEGKIVSLEYTPDEVHFSIGIPLTREDITITDGGYY